MNIKKHLLHIFLFAFTACLLSGSVYAQQSEHIVILWDVTGSLLPKEKGTKCPHSGKTLPTYAKGNGMWSDLKEAIIGCIEYAEEDPSNKISIITFHDHIRDVYARNASAQGKTDLINFVKKYEYEGHNFTNIVAPVEKFYTLLDHKKIDYMFLFTDGDNDSPSTRARFINTLDSWSSRTQGKNAYGFYVLVHPNADKQAIRASVESQENFWIVPDAKVRIKICALPSHLKYNIRDEKGPKTISVNGRYAGVEGKVELKCQDPYYNVLCSDSEFNKGLLHFEVKPKDGVTLPENHTLYLEPAISNSDSYTFIGPKKIELEISNMPERSLNLTINDNNFGEATYYEPFIGFTKDGENIEQEIKVEFSNQAKHENSSALMRVYLVDKEGKNISSPAAQNLKLCINGEEKDTILLTPSTSNITLSICALPNTEDGRYYGRIELIPTRLDNYPINGTQDIFKWRASVERNWHPFKVFVFWLSLILAIMFVIWMIFLRPIFYPRFGSIQKTFFIHNQSPLIIKFKGAKQVIISATPQKQQSFWNKFWTGKIIYKTHPAFTSPIILKPGKRNRILVKANSSQYHITPNPMPGIGSATITDIQNQLKIDVN